MSSNDAGTSTGEATVANQLKLTDLIDDCLEHIFLFVDYRDLYNIAHASKQLKAAADMAFSARVGKKKFRLHVAHPLSVPVVAETTFDVYKLKSSLRLLRCFGHLISNLQIEVFCRSPNTHTNRMKRDMDLLLRYTKEYCSDTLVELSLHHIPNSVFDAVVTKPFTKVQIVEMLRCDLAVDMTNFNAWFPAMRRLELSGNRFAHAAAIAKHFPNLEHLGIVGGGMLGTKFIREALRLNPQLTSFAMNRVYSPEFFRYASKLLPNLVSLKLCGHPKDFCVFRDNPINFKGVKKLEIEFIGEMTEQSVSNIKLSFNQLEEISLDFGKYTYTNGLFAFFEQHISIVKLTLRASVHNTAINENVLSSIVETLPLLNELNFFGIYFSIEVLDNLLNNFNLLKYSFSIETTLQFDNLRILLGNKWRATIDNLCVNVERSN